MAEAGVPIKSVNIGGMAFKTGKTQITKAVSVDESDIAAFKKLHEMGIELEIRPVATDKKGALMRKIEVIVGLVRYIGGFKYGNIYSSNRFISCFWMYRWNGKRA